MNFYPYLPYIFSDLKEIRFARSANNSDGNGCLFENGRSVGLCYFMDINEITRRRTLVSWNRTTILNGRTRR